MPLEVKPTVPVGVGGPAGPTVAVMVTFLAGCRRIRRAGHRSSCCAGWTTCVTVFEVLPSSGGKP